MLIESLKKKKKKLTCHATGSEDVKFQHPREYKKSPPDFRKAPKCFLHAELEGYAKLKNPTIFVYKSLYFTQYLLSIFSLLCLSLPISFFREIESKVNSWSINGVRLFPRESTVRLCLHTICMARVSFCYSFISLFRSDLLYICFVCAVFIWEVHIYSDLFCTSFLFVEIGCSYLAISSLYCRVVHLC